MPKMTNIGRMTDFNPYEEDISSYLLRLKHYFKANEVKDDNKVSILITVIGPKVLAVLSDIISPKKIDEKNYTELCKILEDHYSPKRLVVAERFMFYSRCQKPTETIAEFVVAIKHLASTCVFKTFLMDALRDKLVSGIQNEGIRQKLLSEELDFDQTFALALRLEQAEKQTGIFANQSVHDVSKFSVKRNKNSVSAQIGKSSSVMQGFSGKIKCFRCASVDHKANGCPYSGYKCHMCNKVGHLSKVCKASGAKADKNHKRKYKVHQVEDERCQVRPHVSLNEEMENMALYKLGLNDPGYQRHLI
uniref:CCHC-type domain-containing protein n=1 Tax=Graphocephala atropunctata TaxID=36148 RepID=A0A1B6KSV3_9HEMI